MKLAPALARFRVELAEFPDESAFVLAPLLRKLSLLLGEPAPNYWGSEGDPDGFDGAAVSGTFDRLLPSEFLLLDAEPDEFLRRVVMREQLFFRLARRAPSTEARLHVFLDAGPSQLGSPRLIHLALLVLFAERARRQGATCFISVVQSEEEPIPWEGTEAVLQLLRTRSLREPTKERCEALLARVAPREHEEVHWVGGERLRSLAGELRGRFLEVADPYEFDREVIRVTRVSTERRQSIDLELPVAAERTRLLRNPFEKVAARGLLSEPQGGWFSGYSGHFVAAEPGSLRSFRMDHFPQGTVFEAPPSHELLAGEIFRNGFRTLLREGHRHVLSSGEGRNEVVFEQRRPRFESGFPARLYAIGKAGKFPLVLDDDGVVYTTTTPGGFLFRPLVDHVLTVAVANGSFEVLRRTATDRLELGRIPVGQSYMAGTSVSVSPEAPNFFSCLRGRNLSPTWFLREPTRTSLGDGTSLVKFGVYEIRERVGEVTAPSDHRIVGASFNSEQKKFELLLLSPDRRSIRLGRRVATFEAPLKSATVSFDTRHLFFTDERGRKGFYSSHRNETTFLDGTAP